MGDRNPFGAPLLSARAGPSAVGSPGGGTLALGSEYGGLGAHYKVWTANARVLWPF